MKVGLKDSVPVLHHPSTKFRLIETLNRAREWRAGLIVLGAKGTTSLEEIVLGGTADHVSKEAPCSVLIVRSEEIPPTAAGV